MPIRFEDDRAVMEGTCGVEEALPLLEFVQSRTRPDIDMGGCGLIHSALVQVMMATAVPVAVPPDDPFVRRLLASMTKAGV